MKWGAGNTCKFFLEEWNGVFHLEAVSLTLELENACGI